MTQEEKEVNPPRWATRFLEFYCKPSLLEDLQGDLNEYFQRNVARKGVRYARLVYVIDVVKFFRPYTVRKPRFINLLIQWIMIGSYIKTSGRSILRNKLFSSINIFGLAVSMSVGLLLIGLLTDLSKYDRFHEHGDRVYRVVTSYQYLDQGKDNFASTSPLAIRDVKQDVPGIEASVGMYSGFGNDVKAGDKTIPLEGIWADEGMFAVFSFPMVEGNPAKALKEPFSIVLTETAARRLFGDASALGKTVTLSDKAYAVTGVIKDIPKFSHLKFDMLGSLSTREILEKDRWNMEMKWDNIWQGYLYLLLPEDANLETVQRNLDKIAERNAATIKNTTIALSLQPLYSIALGEDMNNSIGNVMGETEVWTLGVLALVVILSACFNYTNLSIARSLRRSKEVGIRKVVGALRGHVVGQFIAESVIVSLLSLALSFVLFFVLKPHFLTIQPKLSEMVDMNLTAEVLLYFFVFAVAIGLLAGFVPAILFSRINALKVLKDAASVRLLGNMSFRKVLVVAQYVISLVFITITVIGFKQYKYMVSFDLGYKTENILNIDLQHSKSDLFIKELGEMPEVRGMSQSLIITSIGNYYGTRLKYNNPQDSASVNFNRIDENYIPLHDVQLVAGRNFTSLAPGAEESEVIVNLEVLKRFNIAGGDPQKALDEILTVDGKKMKIIGVTENFHYGRAEDRKSEAVLRYQKSGEHFLNVKIVSTDWLTTLEKIEKAWKKVDDVHPLSAEFYSDRIARAYHEVSTMIKMIGFLAFLAVCIASLGLLGMVIFMTEMRLKEVSIRKVLGASERRLVLLLGKGFLIMLLIAGAIALPLTYMFITEVVFTEIQNHISIVPFDLLGGFLVVLAIALVMVGSQTMKVTRMNPAEVLKNE